MLSFTFSICVIHNRNFYSAEGVNKEIVDRIHSIRRIVLILSRLFFIPTFSLFEAEGRHARDEYLFRVIENGGTRSIVSAARGLILVLRRGSRILRSFRSFRLFRDEESFDARNWIGSSWDLCDGA